MLRDIMELVSFFVALFVVGYTTSLALFVIEETLKRIVSMVYKLRHLKCRDDPSFLFLLFFSHYFYINDRKELKNDRVYFGFLYDASGLHLLILLSIFINVFRKRRIELFKRNCKTYNIFEDVVQTKYELLIQEIF